MVSFENVSKFCLSDISLHIPEKSIVGIIGASGAGKTTLLRLSCGLLQCDKGSVRTFFRNPIKNRRQIASDIRVFFSDTPIFQEDGTIQYEFERLRMLYSLKEQCFQDEYRNLAAALQFEEYETKPIRELSLGQRRRAELAAAMFGKARLILLDEPTSGLDEQGKRLFQKLLRQKKEEGAAILVSSYGIAEEEALCDRIILLDKGQLLYYGDRDNLMRRYAPIHEMELMFLGRLPDMEDLPLLRYRMEGNHLMLSYDSNIISAAELITHLMEQTTIIQMHIQRPQLQDVIIKGGRSWNNELF
ncbi:MAG: ABC transporter ATP-binding protein [Eubacteriales bacterium]|nr:ABC transporter ATP-binding protein [Eubacteriales bacterium]